MEELSKFTKLSARTLCVSTAEIQTSDEYIEALSPTKNILGTRRNYKRY
jgi:hypothetical protein